MCESASGCRLPVSYLAFNCFKLSQIELASGCQLPVANSHNTGELASGCRLPVSYLAFIVLNPLKSNWHLAASCQLPIHTNRRISIWLPFAGFLSSFYCFKPSQNRIGIWLPVASCQFTQTGELASGCRLPVFLSSFYCFKLSQIELASGCQLPVANSHNTGELASGCCLPVFYLAFIVLTLSNRIGIWLPVASCQFTQTGELASGCRLPVSYLAFIVLNPLKSNWHLAASCQLPIHTNRRISIWLPFAGFLSSFYCFKPSQIELASGCHLPVANSLECANRHLAAVCNVPIQLQLF